MPTHFPITLSQLAATTPTIRHINTLLMTYLARRISEDEIVRSCLFERKILELRVRMVERKIKLEEVRMEFMRIFEMMMEGKNWCDAVCEGCRQFEKDFEREKRRR